MPTNGVPGFNISAGPLGGGLAHWARFKELLLGREYGVNDTVYSGPTGKARPTDWEGVYRFVDDPKLSDFKPGTRAFELSVALASNYTKLLVELHNVFNGAPEMYASTLKGMYTLGEMAVGLMRDEHDPRFPRNVSIGIGPCWEYVASGSQYVSRGREG